MSETQTAECRSSKPDAAGSIPVAHSNNLSFVISPLSFVKSNRKIFRCVVLIGKTPVSKTEVFSSNLNAPAKFSTSAAKHDCHSHISHFSSRKASQIGLAAVLKTAARQRAYGFESCAFRQFISRLIWNLKAGITLGAWRNGISAVHYE